MKTTGRISSLILFSLLAVSPGRAQTSAGSPVVDGKVKAFLVNEYSRQIDLNGDGDVLDEVLHILNAVSRVSRNLSLAARSPRIAGDLVVFAVVEDSQGNTDLNGDGDTLDNVLHVHDAAGNTTTNVGFAVEAQWNVRGNLVAFAVNEFSQAGIDLNGDGDTSDEVLYVFDAASGATTNVGLATGLRLLIKGNSVLFIVPEASQANTDLNGDGDSSDAVLHIFDFASGTANNTGLDATDEMLQSEADVETLLAAGAAGETGVAPVMQGATPPDFKVAFIGDQGIGPSAVAVLQLIKGEGADLVLHQGDLAYSSNVNTWDQQINNVLGSDFPYFYSIGNHDIGEWAEFQQKLSERLARIPDATCTGDLGVRSSCSYKGLFFILSGVGTMGSAHDTYIRDELLQDESIWRICSWHKNMQKMQVGGKSDETGWEVYEECRMGGAMIATAHEHSYERTRTLISMEKQIVDPVWPAHDDVVVTSGATFAFVSGLGGKSIRDQKRCFPTTFPYGCNGEWASIYTSNQGANYGALFCIFHVNGQPDKAHCYFRSISGNVPDEFDVTSFMGVRPPDIHLDPARLDFARVAVGDSKSLQAEVRNLGGSDLQVSSITTCGGTSTEFSWSPAAPFTVPQGGSQTLTVTYNPTGEGQDTGCLSISSNDPDEDPVGLDVSGDGVICQTDVLIDNTVIDQSLEIVACRITVGPNVQVIQGTFRAGLSVTFLGGVEVHKMTVIIDPALSLEALSELR